ncbi:MAG: diguanylate cyclase [Thermoguttaceae bacterium]
MAETSPSPVDPQLLPLRADVSVPIVARVSQLDSLLAELARQPPRAAVLAPVFSPRVDNQLIQVRLGVASSLFAALRCRYAAAASHCLRVALSCSAWAMRAGLSDRGRDVLEVTALLHDIGYIGIPDQVLLKPGPLDPDESRIIEQSRRVSAEILRHACAEPAILEIIENLGAWYDGSREGYALSGTRLPLGARMLAVAEAFDAMTTDQVFRRAMSQERAIQELFRAAGSQFDPALAREFAELQSGDQALLRREVAQRWLAGLDPDIANSFWLLAPVSTAPGRPADEDLFAARLLDNMHDAVVFVDRALMIRQWNHGAERLTGITSPSICQRPWSPSLLSMQNEKGEWIGEDDCPVACALRSKVQSLRRLRIQGRAGRWVSVDTHAIPVVAGDGGTLGVVLLMHDASPETSLEQRCQSLHEKATRDPLTQVANRAEFDRVHQMFVTAHRQQHIPCSLIICDLDHFKQINDTFGHPAGDEVIKSLATLLKDSCRPGDLVARYGGEEFVVLYADCDNPTAARRAEQIRKRFGQIQHPTLEGRTVTASFGVTEIQPGDTAETMLRRADRALLWAKQKGRNTVVQLGIGSQTEETPRARAWWQRRPPPPLVLEQELLSPVPVPLAVEKLRGFVTDHRARILKIDGNEVELAIDERHRGHLRRVSDRPLSFSIRLQFADEQMARPDSDPPNLAVWRTRVRVCIAPQQGRDRRRGDAAARARDLLVSLRSYLMASEEPARAAEGLLGRVARILTFWPLQR